MESVCYLLTLFYFLFFQFITVANGLTLPFSSITSKVTPLKPSTSLNCSASAFKRPAISGTSNVPSISFGLDPISTVRFQEKLPVADQHFSPSKPSKGVSDFRLSNLCGVQNALSSNLYQELPDVNCPAGSSLRSAINVGNSNTFKVQNPLSSPFPFSNINNVKALPSNFNNIGCGNIFKVQNPVFPNSITDDSFNSMGSSLNSNSLRTRISDSTFDAEYSRSPISDKNNNLDCTNTVNYQAFSSPNYCQVLPEVNLNKYQSLSSNIGSPFSPVSQLTPNQYSSLVSNPFLTTLPIATKSCFPANSNSFSPFQETKFTQNCIPSDTQGFVSNGFTSLNPYLPLPVQEASLSGSQTNLNRISSFIEPQLSFHSGSLPTCNILPTPQSQSFNNLVNNISPTSQNNMDSITSYLEPQSPCHISYSCNHLPSAVPSCNNVFINNFSPFSQSNLDLITSSVESQLPYKSASLPTCNILPSSQYSSSNNNLLPSCNNIPSMTKTSSCVSNRDCNNDASPSISPSSILTNSKESTRQFNFADTFSSFNNVNNFVVRPKSLSSSSIFNDFSENACTNTYLSSNVNNLPEVSLSPSRPNNINQFSNKYGDNLRSLSQNIPLEAPCQNSVTSNTKQNSAINPYNTLSAPSQFCNLGTLSTIQNVSPQEATIYPTWNSFSTTDGRSCLSQINSPTLGKFATTGPFTPEINKLPDVSLYTVNVNNRSPSSSTFFSSFDQLTQSPPQNCEINPLLDILLNNIPSSQASSLPDIHSVPSSLKSNHFSSFYDNLNDISLVSNPFIFQNSDIYLPEVNPFSNPKLTPSGVPSELNRNNILNCDMYTDFNPISRTTSDDCCLPNALPNFGSFDWPTVNLLCYQNLVRPTSDSLSTKLLNPKPVGPQLSNSISISDNCPEAQSFSFIPNLNNPFTTVTNSLAGITSSMNDLPNCKIVDSTDIPLLNFNNALSCKPVINAPNYIAFDSFPSVVQNNALNCQSISSLPYVSCNYNIPQTVNSNVCNSNSIKSNNVLTYSSKTLPSVAPVTYINTCTESVSPLNEFTSMLIKTFIDGALSGSIFSNSNAKIPMTLPPVNPYSNQINSIPTSITSNGPSICLDYPSKSSIMEYQNSAPYVTTFSPPEFNPYINYLPSSTSSVWLDDNISTDFKSRPLTYLPSVNPYMNFNSNVHSNISPSLLSAPLVNPYTSSYAQRSVNFPSDYELLDSYPEYLSSLTSDLSWLDYVDSYDYFEPEIFSDFYAASPVNIVSRPDFAGLMPFVSDLTYSSPSFLPSPNVMPYPYPTPLIKMRDSKESKELERLLEYIVLLELLDDNYNCDWDLLEKTIALLCAYD